MTSVDFDSLFCKVDDFCQNFLAQWNQQWLASGAVSRCREGQLCLSEVMTILITYHLSGFQCFKRYYHFLATYHKKEFPKLISDSRFIE